MYQNILTAFGLDPVNCLVEPFGSGLINRTWKVTGKTQQYVLQCINKSVFSDPQAIADNLVQVQNYLQATVPAYLFIAPLPTVTHDYLVIDDDNYYRLSPFIENSHTIQFITSSNQAYQAAKQFGKFSRLLNDFDTTSLKDTLPDFHNLSLRVDQFRSALLTAKKSLLTKAAVEIDQVETNLDIAVTYRQIVQSKQIPKRVIHHDTKINNVLFNDQGNGLCVIDLDTVMPGYYLSDVGDMMRTYLSEANEEEQDLSKIGINTDYFAAVYKGYMEEMGYVLTAAEKKLFIYAGKLMIYMQAIRFLTDFFNGNVYYHTTYTDHNLDRARNQLTLLGHYLESEDQFKTIIARLDNKPEPTFIQK